VGTLQVGHGSEYHLLRCLGRHRQLFNGQLEAQLRNDGVTAPAAVDWLDFPMDPKSKTWDGEILGVDFLKDHGGRAWQDYWPDREPGKANRRGMPSWDAVGALTYSDGSKDWLLVEAKAHLAEFASRLAQCAAGGASRTKIAAALRLTFESLRANDGPNWETVQDCWLGQYYQLANRLALLHFLRANGHPARLLYVLFAGDSYRNCPRTSKVWSAQFDAAYRAMGLEPGHSLSRWCHRLCLHVGTGERV
jgi:hypothetical protein